MWITSSLATAITPTAIALGNFDGVHRGHQAVIGAVVPNPSPLATEVPLRGLSDRRRAASPLSHPAAGPNAARPVPTVMTFFPHPQEFFTGQTRPLLTPLAEKAAQISRLGIEQLVLLPFDRALADLSPEDFVDKLLVHQLRVQHISVGQDFCFGQGRRGNVDDLRTLAARHGVQVQVAPLVDDGGDRVSSSRIRRALADTDLATAQALLGRPYSLVGRVVRGQRLGRTLGFPTANLHLPPDKVLPGGGVYSAWVQGVPHHPPLPAVLNLGHRPTVNGTALTAEVHLLNWQGDLYDTTLAVQLHSFLRPEQKFASLADLQAQIQRDCQRALGQLARSPVGNSGAIGA